MPAPSSSETTGRTLRSWERESEDAEPLRGSGSGWVSHQVQAMAAAWARGERISVEEILEQHPDLKTEMPFAWFTRKSVSAGKRARRYPPPRW